MATLLKSTWEDVIGINSRLYATQSLNNCPLRRRRGLHTVMVCRQWCEFGIIRWQPELTGLWAGLYKHSLQTPRCR